MTRKSISERIKEAFSGFADLASMILIIKECHLDPQKFWLKY